jgi:hypothetical protein
VLGEVVCVLGVCLESNLGGAEGTFDVEAEDLLTDKGGRVGKREEKERRRQARAVRSSSERRGKVQETYSDPKVVLSLDRLLSSVELLALHAGSNTYRESKSAANVLHFLPCSPSSLRSPALSSRKDVPYRCTPHSCCTSSRRVP